jgi:hypothetical protein
MWGPVPLPAPNMSYEQKQRLAGGGQRPHELLDVEMSPILCSPPLIVNEHLLRSPAVESVTVLPHPLMKHGRSHRTEAIRGRNPRPSRTDVLVLGDIAGNIQHVVELFLLDIPGSFSNPGLVTRRRRRADHSRCTLCVSATVHLHDVECSVVVMFWYEGDTLLSKCSTCIGSRARMHRAFNFNDPYLYVHSMTRFKSGYI